MNVISYMYRKKKKKKKKKKNKKLLDKFFQFLWKHRLICLFKKIVLTDVEKKNSVQLMKAARKIIIHSENL